MQQTKILKKKVIDNAILLKQIKKKTIKLIQKIIKIHKRNSKQEFNKKIEKNLKKIF